LAPQGFVLGIGKLAAGWWRGHRRRRDCAGLAEAGRLQSEES
jgi:branched-chain amino acid transport system permease protein